MTQELITSKLWFAETGTTICAWAESQGFQKELVYAVLSGRIKGVRGEAFHVRRKLLEIARTCALSDESHTNDETHRQEKTGRLPVAS